MEISGNFNVSGLQALGGASRAKSATAAQAAPEAGSLAPVDQLDLSPEAQSLGQPQALESSSTDIRTEKVAALRRAIADGSYETPEKLDAALDRLLDVIG